MVAEAPCWASSRWALASGVQPPSSRSWSVGRGCRGDRGDSPGGLAYLSTHLPSVRKSTMLGREPLGGAGAGGGGGGHTTAPLQCTSVVNSSNVIGDIFK